MAKKNIYEVLNEIKRAPNREARKQILMLNNTPGLQFVLQGAFHPNIQYVFKEPVPYSPASDTVPGVSWASIYDTMNLVYIWVEGSKRVNPNLRFERKRQLLIQHLEALEPREAEVVVNMMQKDLKTKGLSYALVHETFPGLLPAPPYAATPDQTG